MTTNTLKLPPASEAVDIYPYLAVHHPGGGPLDTDNIAPCDVVIVSLSRGMEKEKKVLITPLSFDTWQFFSQKEEEYHPLPKGTQFIIQQ